MLIVFGSINMDMVVQPGHVPQPGETVLSPDYGLFPGGKGANQALAAARMGAKVALVGCAGNDIYARQIMDTIRRQGVMTSGVAHSDRPTGCAVILAEKIGRNRMIVAGGANNDTTADQVPDEILSPGKWLLAQTEVPSDQVFELINRAHACGTRVILNLAPAVPVPLDVLKKLYVLIVNDVEIDQIASALGMTGDNPAALAAMVARQAGIICIVTLAEKGAVVIQPDGVSFHVNALQIESVVDTMGAGDAFCGTFAACLYNKMTLEDAVKYASVAGSLACTKPGTIDAFVYQGDIEARIEEIKITR